jgi:oligoribonuclease
VAILAKPSHNAFATMPDPLGERLIWIDLEMTGLDPQRNVIIEIASIVTDTGLSVIAEGPALAVHQPEAALAAMDAWNTTHHNASGLVERVRRSSVDVAEAERRTLEFVAAHSTAGSSPLCGNSIHQDRRFLQQYMPRLEAHFHYRNIDVSTVKELARRWRPDLLAGRMKNDRHLALDDIRESIEELRYYRTLFFRLH